MFLKKDPASIIVLKNKAKFFFGGYTLKKRFKNRKIKKCNFFCEYKKIYTQNMYLLKYLCNKVYETVFEYQKSILYKTGIYMI